MVEQKEKKNLVETTVEKRRYVTWYSEQGWEGTFALSKFDTPDAEVAKEFTDNVYAYSLFSLVEGVAALLDSQGHEIELTSEPFDATGKLFINPKGVILIEDVLKDKSLSKFERKKFQDLSEYYETVVRSRNGNLYPYNEENGDGLVLLPGLK